MLHKNSAPPTSLAAGRGSGGMAAVGNSRHREYSTSDPFYNNHGKVVGRVLDGWLTKRVDTHKHQLRKPPAWCSDVEHLDRLEAMGARGLHLIDESGQHWYATLGTFRRHGHIPVDRGYGPQQALPLAWWRPTAGAALALDQPEPQQLMLFDLGGAL